MKYENPNMEIIEFGQRDIVITSLGDEGTSAEGGGPTTGWK